MNPAQVAPTSKAAARRAPSWCWTRAEAGGKMPSGVVVATMTRSRSAASQRAMASA